MKTNEFLFEIISCDGNKFSAEIVELNINTPAGMIGILKNHYPLISFVDITTFEIVLNDERKYFAVSGATLNVKKDKTIILCDAFENSNDLDEMRIKARRDMALEKINNKDKYDYLDLVQAERSLKKALNRLSLIK